MAATSSFMATRAGSSVRCSSSGAQPAAASATTSNPQTRGHRPPQRGAIDPAPRDRTNRSSIVIVLLPSNSPRTAAACGTALALLWHLLCHEHAKHESYFLLGRKANGNDALVPLSATGKRKRLTCRSTHPSTRA